jgi:hypothetical protein
MDCREASAKPYVSISIHVVITLVHEELLHFWPSVSINDTYKHFFLIIRVSL